MIGNAQARMYISSFNHPYSATFLLALHTTKVETERLCKLPKAAQLVMANPGFDSGVWVHSQCPLTTVS